MSAGEMTKRIAEASPRFKARIAGVFYLLVFVTGGLAFFVRGRLGSTAGLTEPAVGTGTPVTCTPMRDDGIRRLRRLHRSGIEADKLNSSENGCWMFLFAWREGFQHVCLNS